MSEVARILTAIERFFGAAAKAKPRDAVDPRPPDRRTIDPVSK
jgi:hypothetical protein